MSLGLAPLATEAGDSSAWYDGVALPALWTSPPETPQKAAPTRKPLKVCQNRPNWMIQVKDTGEDLVMHKRHQGNHGHPALASGIAYGVVLSAAAWAMIAAIVF